MFEALDGLGFYSFFLLVSLVLITLGTKLLLPYNWKMIKCKVFKRHSPFIVDEEKGIAFCIWCEKPLLKDSTKNRWR